MNKTVLLILIIFCFGCEKEHICKTCTQTMVVTVGVADPAYPQTYEIIFEACDDELEAIDPYPVVTYSWPGHYLLTTTTTTRCR